MPAPSYFGYVEQALGNTMDPTILTVTKTECTLYAARNVPRMIIAIGK